MVLAYSRVVSWGRDFKAVERYVIKNLLEAEGAFTKTMTLMQTRSLGSILNENQMEPWAK